MASNTPAASKTPTELKSDKALGLWARIQSKGFTDYVTVNAQITRLHIMGPEANFLRAYAKANLPGRGKKPGGSL
jgi:hypothetical protein